MFDEDTKITLFIVLAAAFVLTMTLERTAPRAELAAAVDIARLPSLPHTVGSDGSPAQTRVARTRVDLGGGFGATLLHGYVLEGRVVTQRTYRHDATSAVSPLDLGIVWGDLADPGRADAVDFSAVRRGVRYSPRPDAILPKGWETQITNNHLVPANQAVNDALMAVEVGDRVRIRGYLVEVTGERTAPWKSSTRRDDNTIIGGCEIILVTGVEVLREGQTAA